MSGKAHPLRTIPDARWRLEADAAALLQRQDSRRPLFRQIMERLEVAMDNADGARLPTERQLTRIFAVSRITVRRALLELNKVGRIDRHVGRGTFVK